MTRNIVRRGIAAAAVIGATATGAVVWASTASAMPTDQLCDADQLTAELVAGDPGAGQRYAELEFTAKDQQSCKLEGALPVTLAGAPGVTVADDGSESVPVYVTAGHPAHVLLHWTGIEASGDQAIPDGITIDTPGPLQQSLTLPWNQGALDASAQAHTLIVGSVQPGPATRA